MRYRSQNLAQEAYLEACAPKKNNLFESNVNIIDKDDKYIVTATVKSFLLDWGEIGKNV